MEQVVHLTGIKYHYGSEDCLWSLPDDLDREAEVLHACEWLGMRVDISLPLTILNQSIETALHQFRNSEFWHSNSAEALCRTPIDMILFDRLAETRCRRCSQPCPQRRAIYNDNLPRQRA